MPEDENGIVAAGFFQLQSLRQRCYRQVYCSVCKQGRSDRGCAVAVAVGLDYRHYRNIRAHTFSDHLHVFCQSRKIDLDDGIS